MQHCYQSLHVMGLHCVRSVMCRFVKDEMSQKYKEETHSGCLNYSASINYSGISCGLTKINRFSPVFSSRCLHSVLFPADPQSLT